MIGAVWVAVVDHKAPLGRALVALEVFRPDRRAAKLDLFDHADRAIHSVERQGSRGLGHDDMVNLGKGERRRWRGRASEEQREDRGRARRAEQKLHRCARLAQCPLRSDFGPIAAWKFTKFTGS